MTSAASQGTTISQVRIWPIALLLFASASALAQGESSMVTPTKNGLAEGTSIYVLDDGTRMETTWKSGRKHGPYRKVNKAGVILEEVEYQGGQRVGEWIQRDDLGNMVGSGHYLLGLLHGQHERYETLDEGRHLIESTTYVLGIKHGPALLRDGPTGLSIKGKFAWDGRHGHFRSTTGEPAYEQRFFCDAPIPSTLVYRPFDIRQGCDRPSAIDLQLPATDDLARLDRGLASSLCQSQAILGIPVVLNGEPISCSDAANPPKKEEEAKRYVQDLYEADDIVRIITDGNLANDVLSAYFTQTSLHGGRKHPRTQQSTGSVDIYGDGRVEWLLDAKAQCDFLIRPSLGNIDAIKNTSRRRATKPLSESALAWVTAFAAPLEKLLETYSAEFANHKGDNLVIDLLPRMRHSHLERISLAFEIKGPTMLSFKLKSVSVRLHEGDVLFTELHGLSRATFPTSSEEGSKSMFDSYWSEYAITDADGLRCVGQIW